MKRDTTIHKLRPELYDAPRIQVISRPHHFKPRLDPHIDVAISRASQELHPYSASPVVLPLPNKFPQLPHSYAMTDKEKVKEMMPTDSSLPFSRSSISSSPDDQHLSNRMYDRKVKSEANSVNDNVSPSPRVIHQIATMTQSKIDLSQLKQGVIKNSFKRKVILQERNG